MSFVVFDWMRIGWDGSDVSLFVSGILGDMVVRRSIWIGGGKTVWDARSINSGVFFYGTLAGGGLCKIIGGKSVRMAF